MDAGKATTDGGSVRTNPDELIRYEDHHVKLTETELLLKTYYNNENGHTSVSILLSDIVHVCWAGSEDNNKKKNPSLFAKLKKTSEKSKTEKQKIKPTGNKIGNVDDRAADEDEEAAAGTKKEHHKKQNSSHIRKRFVVVASTKGSQQTTGYGFSVLEDPLLFHKLIQPSHYYVAIEQQANAKTAGNFIRNLSKDHLSSLMGGGGGEATTKNSTANKNDTKIMASGTLGSAISTGELQSLLAGYHLDDVRGS